MKEVYPDLNKYYDNREEGNIDMFTIVHPATTIEWVAVGEFRKTCHPRNVKVYEIREMSFQEHQIHEDLESRICEVLKSRMCRDLESRTCEALKSRIREDPKS
jgi:hypothetical protein